MYLALIDLYIYLFIIAECHAMVTIQSSTSVSIELRFFLLVYTGFKFSKRELGVCVKKLNDINSRHEMSVSDVCR